MNAWRSDRNKVSLGSSTFALWISSENSSLISFSETNDNTRCTLNCSPTCGIYINNQENITTFYHSSFILNRNVSQHGSRSLLCIKPPWTNECTIFILKRWRIGQVGPVCAFCLLSLINHSSLWMLTISAWSIYLPFSNSGCN